MEGLTRGQLAQRAQINLETVRYYEQEGLLAPPARTASGYRKFAESAIDRVAFVKRAKALGFSLGEIRELLAIQDGHADACVEVRDLVEHKLAVVRDKLADLEELETHLRSALRKCNQALKRQQPQQNLKACPVLNEMSGSNGRKRL
jgi:MerR family mercuric resistance operon transcriptional regulator